MISEDDITASTGDPSPPSCGIRTSNIYIYIYSESIYCILQKASTKTDDYVPVLRIMNNDSAVTVAYTIVVGAYRRNYALILYFII